MKRTSFRMNSLLSFGKPPPDLRTNPVSWSNLCRWWNCTFIAERRSRSLINYQQQNI